MKNKILQGESSRLASTQHLGDFKIRIWKEFFQCLSETMGFHFSIPISVLRSALRYAGDPSAFLRLPGSTVPRTSPRPRRVVCCPLAHSSCFSCVNWPWLTLLTQDSPAGSEKDSLLCQPCDEDIRKAERDADRASFHSPSTKKLKTA